MPTVPTYEPNQVRQTALPATRVSTDAPIEAFGGGASKVTDAAAGFGQKIEQIALKEKDKVDEIAATDAYNRTLQKKNELLYDPKIGAMTRKGKDSFGASEQYGGDFDKFADTIEGELSNAEQRFFYQKMRARVKMDLEENLNKHTFQEGQRYEEQVFEATNENLSDDAKQNYHVPGKLAKNVDMLRANIESFGARRGLPPEKIKMMAEEETAKTYSGVIGRMLANGQDIPAKQLYDGVKDKVVFGDMAAAIEANLEEGSTRGESQRIVEEIMKESSDLNVARATMKARNLNPKLQDAVDDRLKMEYGLRDKQDHVNRTKTFMDSYATVEKTKDRYSIPPDQWNTLLPGQKKAIEILAKQAALGEEPVQDDRIYMKYGMAMPDAVLAKVTEAELIEKVKPFVHRPKFDEILHRWGRVTQAANSPKARQEAKSIYNDNEMIIEVMKAHKIGGIQRTDSASDIADDEAKATAVARMKELRDQAVFSFAEKNGGKSPNDKQTKEILDDMVLRKVFVKNTDFGIDWLDTDDEVVAAVATPEQLKAAYVPLNKIPPRAKTELINRARAQGHITPDVTDERAMVVLKDNIERAYAARAAGMGLDVVDEILSEN